MAPCNNSEESALEYKRNELPVDFAGEVRLFPLPDLVLYPGCVQPLHVFESRYREMLEDSIQHDQLLAIATLMPGYEVDYYSRPPVADYICVGQVVMHEKTAEGTYNLILVGACRARIKHEITPVRSYRRAFVEVIGETPLADVTSAEELGAQLTKRVMSVSESTEKLAVAFRDGKITLSNLTDVIAFYSPLDTDLKLRLLKEPDASKRARRLLAAFNTVTRDAGKQSTQPASESIKDSPRFPPQFGDN